MSFEHSEAIVLRKVDFSETSRIVTFLTPDRGRMACMVKGARRKGSPMATLLDTYNRLEITYTWKESRQVQLLTEATLLDSYGTLKTNVEHIACAAFLLEVAAMAAFENNPAPELFAAAQWGFKHLDKKEGNPVEYLVRSLYLVLEAAGYAPDPTDEILLGPASTLSRNSSPSLREALTSLSSGNYMAAPETVLPMLRFLKEYSEHHFEKSIKSFSFLLSVLQYP